MVDMREIDELYAAWGDAYKAKYGVWTSDVANYNNWRGAQGGIYGWAGGGFYFYDQHNNLEQDLKALYNPSHGIHWDTDNANISATNSKINMNNTQRDSLFQSVSSQPVVLLHSQ